MDGEQGEVGEDGDDGEDHGDEAENPDDGVFTRAHNHTNNTYHTS